MGGRDLSWDTTDMEAGDTVLFDLSSVTIPFPASFSGSEVFSVFITLVFGFWALYTLAATYHWIRYSHRSWIAVPALAAHVAVSAAIASFAVTGLR